MTRDVAFQVIEEALTIVSNRGMAREMALAKTALAILRDENDATKNEAASAEEVGPPNAVTFKLERAGEDWAAQRHGWVKPPEGAYPGRGYLMYLAPTQEEAIACAALGVPYVDLVRAKWEAIESAMGCCSFMAWVDPRGGITYGKDCHDLISHLVGRQVMVHVQPYEYATSADASPAQNPAKATTEEDPVTDKTEGETTTNERTPAVRKVE